MLESERTKVYDWIQLTWCCLY